MTGAPLETTPTGNPPAAPAPAANAAEPRPRKSEQTKARIVDVALDLFLEHGFEGTTMRAIAKAADVSVGNAYYYFDSKEHLIQEYYGRIQQMHAAAVRPKLETARTLADRLRAVVRTHIDVIEPYHDFAGVLFKSAADPKSPLSPFSAESSEAREASLALFTELVDGSDAKLAKDLRAELPELLWLYQLGLVLYWVHDDSPGTERTYILIERTVPLIDKLISLSRLPVVRPITRQVIDLVRELRGLPAR